MRQVVAALLVLGIAVVLPVAGAAAAPSTYHNPLTADDAPDPDVVSSGGVYYAFTTGGTFGHIQEFRSATLVSWQPVPWPGALASEPAWAVPGDEWAPSVAEIDGTWVMYYATFDAQADSECVTEATSATAAGPYVNDSARALACSANGAIDPDVFIDADGTASLVWKSEPSTVVSEQLAPDGLSFAPDAVRAVLTQADQGWETTVENPDLVEVDGLYYLFYSGGTWTTPSYAVGYALCAGPEGPCGQPSDRPILAAAGAVAGPGGESVFQDASGQWWMAYAAWTAGAVGYPRGARSLRMDPLCFESGGQPTPGTPVVPGPTSTAQPLVQSCPTTDPAGYRLAAADGGLFAYGGAAFFGSAAGRPLPGPVAGTATDPAGGGYWEVGADGTVYPFDAPFDGEMAGRPLAAPVVGMAATPDGGGYWLVSADGGVFAFGDAGYFGSAAALHLAAPVVGMAATPDGGGYWLVAADGGVFAFGDAGFFGSMGGVPLDAPVVGVAAMADGLGYWEVAADGGVFALGDAPFHGSMGGAHLNAPVVGLATDGPGGYWEVAADGGVFAFGSAGFAGSAGSLQLARPVVGLAPA